MENEIENANSNNGEAEAEAVVEAEVVQTEEEAADERDTRIAELEAKAADLEAKNKQLFERAKKAKAAAQPADALTSKDTYALINAKVDLEDFDEVKSYADFKKLPISDALKDKTLLGILNDRNEERRTANATQTRSARGSSKVSGDDLIDKVKSGGDVAITDIDKLAEARMARLKAKTR